MAWQLVEAKDANAKDANEADAQAKALDNALKKVVDSKLAKELESAKTQLRKGVDGANKTFKDTDGKVADNATRDSLRKAIDEANAILNKKDVSDPEDLHRREGQARHRHQKGERLQGCEGECRRRGSSQGAG